MEIKRILSLVLIIVFALIILTACNTKKDLYSKAQFTNAYKIHYLEMPEGYTGRATVIGDEIHVIYIKMEYVYDDEGIAIDIFQSNLLYIYNLNGEVLDIINLSFCDNYGDNFGYRLIPSGDDTFYFVDDQPRGQLLKKLTYDDIVIWEFDYPTAFGIEKSGGTFATYIDYDTNYMYIMKSSGLFIINSVTGEPVQFIPNGFEVLEITKSHDDEIILKAYSDTWMYEESRYKYYVVNTKNRKLDEYKLPKLPDTFTNYSYTYGEVYYNGSFAVEYEMYYKDNSGLYGYDPETTKSELLVNWTNSDLFGQDTTVLSVITPDVVLCEIKETYSQSRWYSHKTITPSLALLTRIPDDEVAQKTILTISTTSSGQNMLIQTAVMFNRQSDKYRVVIDDYSIYNTDENYTRGTEIFDFDIASGVIHDINFISITPEKYLNKGMFADLYELFDSDLNISRDHLLGVIRRNNETDGRFYMIPSRFTIYTLIGKPSIVGANENLTIDEVIKLNENLPPNTTLFTNCGRDDIFGMIIRVGTSKYIDYKTAKCNFTDSSFIKMIEFVKTLPESIGNGWYYMDYADEEIIEKIRNDNSYLFEYAFYSIESFINLKYIYGDEEYVIKGYPNETGNGSNILNSDFFAINSKSPNKEGAWEFIKFYLSDEIQLYQTTLPITNSFLSYILDDYLSKYFYTQKNYISTGAIQMLDEPIEQSRRDDYDDFYFTETDATEIKRFLNEVPVVPKYDNTVFEIIYEEISAFFADAITAEQCAGYIQNRVQLYLHEQK